MPGKRRSSWKTSSQRHSRSGAANQSNNNSNSNNGINNHHSQYTKQLNPYKQLKSSQTRNGHPHPTLRESQGSVHRGLSDDEHLGITDDDLDLDLSDDLGDDDDDLGLDNILSSLEAINDRNENKKSGGDLLGGATKNDSSKSNQTDGSTTLFASGIDEKKDNDIIIIPQDDRKMPQISQVDFGVEKPPPIQNTSSIIDNGDNISTVSEGDNDTLWTDGDATLEHKMMFQAGQGLPAFASGGFDDTARLMEPTMTGPSFQTGAKKGCSLVRSSLVDSIIDDITAGDHQDNVSTASSSIHDISGEGQQPSDINLPPLPNSSNALTPPRGVGRYSYRPRGILAQQQKGIKPDLTAAVVAAAVNNKNNGNIPSQQLQQQQHDAPAQQSAHGPKKNFNHTNDLRSNNNNNNNNISPPSKVTTTRKKGIMTTDETLSTVTDPTESPFIYTYKKPHDDDSVSQITSSLAGSSLASSNLQNVPTYNTSSSSRRTAGLTWMNSNGGTGINGVGGSSRMIHRKAVAGPYGRRERRTPKFAANTATGNNGRNSRGSSHSGSGSADGSINGGGVGGSNLDENAYALNADSMPGGGRKNQRIPSSSWIRPPPPRASARNNHREMSMEDLSTVESIRDGYTSNSDDDAQEYIETNLKSNVSRLGMGGVSTGAQSVSETTAISESTSSTMGLIQSLALFAWKAQHHATRYFFPTSAKVTRRKKFDIRCDSDSELEDILLEEGANTLGHRKKQQRGGIRHGRDEEDEEEIDYFSRAMSISNNHHTSRKSNNNKSKKYCWKTSTARVGGLFFLLTVGITVYRMPEKENNSGGMMNTLLTNQVGEFRTGNERFYNPVQYQGDNNGDGQVFDYATGALVDSGSKQAFHNNNNGQASVGIELGASGRLGQPMENNIAAAAEAASNSESLTAFDTDNEQLQQQQLQEQQPPQEQQHFLVQGNVHLPSKFEALANVDDILFQRGIDVPLYWHVPRSGGGTMNDVLGSCLHLTLAADAGGSEGHGQEETLKIIHFSRKVAYVNVDTSTHQGIARAKNLNLVSSGLADVVISPLLHEASTLFTPTRRGRMFTVVRHPVERAASLFYFIQETQWRQPGTRNDQFAEISIEEFYKKQFAENNWMTRFLTNELTKGELTENDLNIAKEVLRQKCLVGLLEEKGESFDRVLKFFGWRPKNEEEQNCLQKKLEWSWPMKHKHPTIEEDSRAWRFIMAANKFDMKLYDYAKDLFAQQGQLFQKSY